jgi:nucleolin
MKRLANVARFTLRRAAFRVLSSPSASLYIKPRSFTTVTSLATRPTKPTYFAPLQKRFASDSAAEAETRAHSEAGGATEVHHRKNSKAASAKDNAATSGESDLVEAADAQGQSTVASAVSSAKDTVASKVSDAADAISDSASAAGNTVGEVAAKAADAVGSSMRGSPPVAGSPTNLYVGNLFFDVSEDDLRREFSKYGEIKSLKIVYDGRGLSKGYFLEPHYSDCH